MLSINGARLARAITESNMTEKSICAYAGVGHKTLQKMLAGQMVRFPAVGKICKELGISASEIIVEATKGETAADALQRLGPRSEKSADDVDEKLGQRAVFSSRAELVAAYVGILDGLKSTLDSNLSRVLAANCLIEIESRGAVKRRSDGSGRP